LLITKSKWLVDNINVPDRTGQKYKLLTVKEASYKINKRMTTEEYCFVNSQNHFYPCNQFPS